MLGRLGVFVAIVVSLAGSLAFAQDASLRRQMALLLYSYDTPTEAQWRSLDQGAQAMLIRIASSSDQPRRARLRSLSALEFFPSDQTRRYLRKVLFGKRTESVYTRRAAIALARGFGGSTLDDLASRLKDKRVDVRRSIVTAISMIDDERVPAILGQHLKRESDDSIRRSIQALSAHHDD
ncbi:MAG: HEAT repeat domain-containing protein [Polyangiales bacterium]